MKIDPLHILQCKQLSRPTPGFDCHTDLDRKDDPVSEALYRVHGMVAMSSEPNYGFSFKPMLKISIANSEESMLFSISS